MSAQSEINYRDFPAVPERINALNTEIAGENKKYTAAKEKLSIKSLRETVLSDIGEIQLDLFHELLEKAQPIPYTRYEQLGERAIELDELIRGVEDENAVLSEKANEKLQQLREQVELAVSLAPRRAEDISRIESEESLRITNSVKKKIVEGLVSEQDEINTLLTEYGEPWTVPLGISGADRKLLYGLVEESALAEANTFIVEDIIPITPDERVHQADMAEKAKHVIENHDASNYITYYLAEKVGKVVTVEELAQFLYVANVEERRNNITTLLGPKIQGQRIQKYLLRDYGLKLQYGWRHLKEVDGDRTIERSRTRIYRAVDETELHDTPARFEIALENGMVVEDTLEVIKRPELAIDTNEIEVVVEVAEVVIEEKPQTEAQDTPDVARTNEWEQHFHDAVEIAIEKLKADMLFEDDEMRGTTIRSLGSSAAIGTETMRNRMKEAGLMRIGQVKSDIMTREQRVIGILLNANIDLLSRQRGRQTQKRAIEIVQNAIQTHLK
jgi:hypothetical protein